MLTRTVYSGNLLIHVQVVPYSPILKLPPPTITLVAGIKNLIVRTYLRTILLQVYIRILGMSNYDRTQTRM